MPCVSNGELQLLDRNFSAALLAAAAQDITPGLTFFLHPRKEAEFLLLLSSLPAVLNGMRHRYE